MLLLVDEDEVDEGDLKNREKWEVPGGSLLNSRMAASWNASTAGYFKIRQY